MPLDFITSNPATAAFQRGSEFLQQEEARDLQLRAARHKDAQDAALAASDLRAAQAKNDRVVAETDEYTKTSPFRVEVARGQAAQVPDNIEQNRIQTQAAGVTLDSATDDLQEKRDRRGLRDIQANATVKDVEHDQANREVESLTTVYKLIAAGQPSAAKRALSVYNLDGKIPDEELNNVAKGKLITDTIAEANRRYPGRPADQFQYLQGQLQRMNDPNFKPQDAAANPTTAVDVPNAPAPQQTGSGRNDMTDFDRKVQMAQQIGYSPKEAFDIATGNKPVTDQEMVKMAQEYVRTMYPPSDIMNPISPAQRKAEFQRVYDELRSGSFGKGSAPGAPAAPGAGRTQPNPLAGDDEGEDAAPAAPAAAGQKPASIKGAGSESDPFQGAGSADLNWFKTSAPKGARMKIFDASQNKYVTVRKP